jgi:hypothetical protein
MTTPWASVRRVLRGGEYTGSGRRQPGIDSALAATLGQAAILVFEVYRRFMPSQHKRGRWELIAAVVGAIFLGLVN